MALYNFQKRFADKVESGEKTHTIRARRSRQTKVGEVCHLYTGLRSKGARKLRPDNPKCLHVWPIEIYYDGMALKVVLDNRTLGKSELRAFALSDGFSGLSDFLAFWQDVHGLTPNNPLKNFELIAWEQKKAVQP